MVSFLSMDSITLLLLSFPRLSDAVSFSPFESVTRSVPFSLSLLFSLFPPALSVAFDVILDLKIRRMNA